ncbi:L-alanine-DL-glutamate epimerase-like enolase superfamily enzyme [Mesorhizobium sp. J18]|uniref:N-acetyl-D-Glu racemase DgcA n=1 Tax=Mesorhizobium sp. J18 TaxID=935263 RepID=UPI00119A82FB|nr:N-acetyl-D-Glu racemase DgcA [Mesorhizobium sp. J18]TWG93811.1 L-alanine-DL-glutamate epimerase-like enolase superfamily enzyme [Mesorhizobium sp. J18]
MSRELSVEFERFPIAGKFTISRGSKTEAEVVTCIIRDGDCLGRGECVPYGRYDETLESVREEIEARRQDVAEGAGREDLLSLMKPGAARNAIDCALWDLEAKLENAPAHLKACSTAPRPVTTAMTISLDTPDEMAAQARANAFRPLLKVKVGTDNDIARIHAIRAAAPNSRIILDANEGWTEANIHDNLVAAAEFRISLIEQPLPAGKDGILREIPHPVPVCADESIHTGDDLDKLAGLYDAINIKLDKTGGLTAALQLRERARELGFGIMVGCMVGTSLAMAPAVLLAQEADYVDLDGPLLLARDRHPALRYRGSLVSPPSSALWG